MVTGAGWAVMIQTGNEYRQTRLLEILVSAVKEINIVERGGKSESLGEALRVY